MRCRGRCGEARLAAAGVRGGGPAHRQKQYRPCSGEPSARRSSALAVLVTEVDGGVVEPKKCTVAELLDAWLEHIENVGRSPSTLYGYRRLVRQLPPGFLAQPLAKVTPKVVDDLYRFLARQTSRKPATVLRFHTVLRAAFAQAVRWGWLDRNPIERATPPRVHSIETVPPTVVDVLRVLDRAAASRNPENAMVFRIVAATGCRRGEVCALKWSDVDLDGDAAAGGHPPGRPRPRRPAHRVRHQDPRPALDPDRPGDGAHAEAQRDRAKELAEAAGVEFSTDDFVFPRSPGSTEPLPPNRIGQAWRRLCREVGVEARLHDLRHLQASLLLDAGEAITTVSARLGHRDTSTTLKIYSHLMPGADQRAAEIVGKAFAGRPPRTLRKRRIVPVTSYRRGIGAHVMAR